MALHDLTLPPGTSLMISEPLIVLALDWLGPSGRHMILLRQTLEGSEGLDRDEAIAKAVVLFCNVVGLEMINKAMHAGEWPANEAGEGADNPSGEPHRTNEF